MFLFSSFLFRLLSTPSFSLLLPFPLPSLQLFFIRSIHLFSLLLARSLSQHVFLPLFREITTKCYTKGIPPNLLCSPPVSLSFLLLLYLLLFIFFLLSFFVLPLLTTINRSEAVQQPDEKGTTSSEILFLLFLFSFIVFFCFLFCFFLVFELLQLLFI